MPIKEWAIIGLMMAVILVPSQAYNDWKNKLDKESDAPMERALWQETSPQLVSLHEIPGKLVVGTNHIVRVLGDMPTNERNE